MNITDHLRQATDDSGADGLDLDRLARVARTQGTRARRRRRGTALLGSVAAVAAVVWGSTAMQGPDTVREGTVAVGETPTPSAVPTSAPFTGRGVVAALREAVSDVAQGRSGAYAGQNESLGEENRQAFGRLDWTAVDGLGVSVIEVNLQPGFDFVSSCDSDSLRCTSTTTSHGTLTTYEEHTPVAAGLGIRRVADFLRADGVRIVVGASNGYDLPSNGWDVTRPQPALSFAQLTEVVKQPWWDAELPQRFLDQGEKLAPYDDLDSPASSATPSAK